MHPAPVSFHTSHVSIVSNARSPFCARSRAPSMLSRSHSIFVPEKYASATSPVKADPEDDRDRGKRVRPALEDGARLMRRLPAHVDAGDPDAVGEA